MKKEIINFYTTYKFYIFPLMIILSSIMLIIFVIYPQTIKLLTNQRAAGEISKKSDFLITKTQALESYDSTDLSSKVDIVLRSFPTDKDYAQAFGLLQNLTAQFGFSINSLTLGSSISSAANNVQAYGIKLEILGPKSTFLTLINSLENSTRLLRVSDAEVTFAKDQTIQASINIDVLYSPDTGSFGNVDSPLPDLSQKDNTILARLTREGGASAEFSQPSSQLPARGKANPFE